MNRRCFLIGLASAGAVGCQSTRDAAADKAPTLRVLSYNVHHGEGVDGRLDLERIAAVIRAANPDLAALQEVDQRAQRTGGIDQPAEYIRLTGMHGWFGAAMPFQGGAYGQVLLSRWPMRTCQIVRLPGSPGVEPRIAVTALVDAPRLGRIRWVGLHLDAGREDGDRWEQAGTLIRELGRDGIPTLMAGDFNARPDSRVMQHLLDPSTGWLDTAGAWAAPTSPAESPRSRIDYVLASPRTAWETVQSEVISEAAASDHRPLLVVLRLRK